MNKIHTMTFIIFLVVFAASPLFAQPPSLSSPPTPQLIVDGSPFLILGGELGNSSASSARDIERIFPKLERMGLNTVLVPAYWDLIEPVEGQFDFSLIDKTIWQAQENNLKVVFLWFGAWKNSMSCYAPLWFKQDYKKYPRAYTKAGKPLEIAASFSENVLKADNKAFGELMTHIAEVDVNHTVIMMQIENEIGMLEDARDYSKVANEKFNAPVPEALTGYLKKNKKLLHPQMLAKWEAQGGKTKGTWQEIFGDDLYTDEIFMAWSYARYVEQLAQTARAIHHIPLYVNAAMNSRNRKPGEYPSAGPLAHLIDIWHCGAPSIDILAPDLYDNDFAAWVAKYHLHNNPLFIPEVKRTRDNGVQALYVFGEHDAIGYSPFSIEDGNDDPDDPNVKAYAKLKELMPVITRYQGKGMMKGLLFDREHRERTLDCGDLILTCRHFFTLPWDSRATDGTQWPEAGGVIIRLSKTEFLVAGNGIMVEFHKKGEEQTAIKNLGEDGFANAGGTTAQTEALWNGNSRVGLGPVDEVSVSKEGNFAYVRRLNGDQTHQGRHVRISVGDVSILHVTLYEYK